MSTGLAVELAALVATQGTAPTGAVPVTVQTRTPFGPTSFLDPAQMQGAITQLQSYVATFPRLRALVEQPTAQALISDVTRQLTQRTAARTFKLLLAGRDGDTVAVEA